MDFNKLAAGLKPHTVCWHPYAKVCIIQEMPEWGHQEDLSIVTLKPDAKDPRILHLDYNRCYLLSLDYSSELTPIPGASYISYQDNDLSEKLAVTEYSGLYCALSQDARNFIEARHNDDTPAENNHLRIDNRESYRLMAQSVQMSHESNDLTLDIYESLDKSIEAVHLCALSLLSELQDQEAQQARDQEISKDIKKANQLMGRAPNPPGNNGPV